MAGLFDPAGRGRIGAHTRLVDDDLGVVHGPSGHIAQRPARTSFASPLGTLRSSE